MGLFRASRKRRGPDPYLPWKIGIFALGAVIALFGIFTKRDVAVLAAIVVLAIGLLLRLLTARRS